MKSKDFLKELRSKSLSQLLDELEKIRNDKSQTAFNVQMSKEKNVKKISKQKKNIAQILTIISEKAESQNE